MGVFNISFLKPGATKGGGSGYGVLIDQLAILESQLAGDGNLSPGDYDVLTKKAREIALTGGLTADQRSNVNVKIADLEKRKKVSAIGDTNDIARLNRDIEDKRRTTTMLFGNDPKSFVQDQIDNVSEKVERLTLSINQVEQSGGDTSSLVNEQVGALQDLQDLLDAKAGMDAYQPGSGKVASDMVAYLETNSRGEITKVDIGHVGRSGYAETDGLYGGLQIYGKPNSRSRGAKVFRLGNTEYKGSDMQVQDPENPLSFRDSPLTSGPTKGFQMKVDLLYDADLSKVRTQQVIHPGTFARGKAGMLYEALPDGRYRKYVDTVPDQLGRGDLDILDIPGVMEEGINNNASETVYGADMPQMSLANPAQLNSLAANQPSTPVNNPAPTPVGDTRTPAPTDRSPRQPAGIASRAMDAAKRFIYGK